MTKTNELEAVQAHIASLKHWHDNLVHDYNRALERVQSAITSATLDLDVDGGDVSKFGFTYTDEIENFLQNARRLEKELNETDAKLRVLLSMEDELGNKELL